VVKPWFKGRSSALSLAEKGVDVYITYHSNRERQPQECVEALTTRAESLGCSLTGTRDVPGVYELYQGRIRPTQSRICVVHDGLLYSTPPVYRGYTGQQREKPRTKQAGRNCLAIHVNGPFFLTPSLRYRSSTTAGLFWMCRSGSGAFLAAGILPPYAMDQGARRQLWLRYMAKSSRKRQIRVTSVGTRRLLLDLGGGNVVTISTSKSDVVFSLRFGSSRMKRRIGQERFADVWAKDSGCDYWKRNERLAAVSYVRCTV